MYGTVVNHNNITFNFKRMIGEIESEFCCDDHHSNRQQQGYTMPELCLKKIVYFSNKKENK